ncbi:G-type lectin S-receptor-like serine/threonine-protein kinase, partial [Mucuna pruriens]
MSRTSTSVDHLAVSQSIRDGETLVSAGGIVEVGFFSPGNPTIRYLGIWYTNVSPLTVVWVANRNTPLVNKSGVLKLNEKGILVLLNATNNTIWSSNISTKAVSSPIAHLLDSGNFVVKNGHETNLDSLLWQSFDYPGDTLIPGMKIGWNLETGVETSLSSWKRVDDPAEGEYAIKMDIRGYPQLLLLQGPDIEWRVGSWNGFSIVGYPLPASKLLQKFVFNKKEVYCEFEFLEGSLYKFFKLNPSGTLTISLWTTKTSTPHIVPIGQKDQCDNYAICGSNSICNYVDNHITCECLRGYVPKSPHQWNIAIWFDGCVPRNKSNCKNSSTDGFFKYTHMKLPDTSSSWFNTTMNLDECQKLCLQNCSCLAYANLDIRAGGSGCLLWFNTLVDMRKLSQWGQDLYFRVPASELDHGGHRNIKAKIVVIIVGVTVFGFGLIITCVSILIIKNPGAAGKIYNKHYKNILRKEDIDLPTFDLSVLANATGNFSIENKIGEGGFGAVYKGTLTDGKELAVKRLSKKSGQGLDEFKNEVALIAKLQHRNLVTLLGCCIEGEEIIGYMPPEYAARGHFSVKSDVFSYGVIVLEIISGKKNREFLDPEHYNNLLGHAWRLWTKERALELLDEVLGEQCTPAEVIRCIEIGLLCVQQRPEDRPDMSSVVLMLNGDKLLPKPKVPGFYTETDVTSKANSLSGNHMQCSVELLKWVSSVPEIQQDDTPLENNSGVVKVNERGFLELINATNQYHSLIENLKFDTK